MTYSPPQWYRPPSICVTPCSPEADGLRCKDIVSGAFASAVWPTTNLAILFPFVLSQPITVQKMFVCNGSAVSGNFDIGIYDDGGGSSTVNKIVTAGSTAQAGTNAPQTVSITATALLPGRYYAALCFDNGTGAVFSKAPAQASFAATMGFAQVANGAVTLGSTLALAAMTTAYVPLFGLSQKATV